MVRALALAVLTLVVLAPASRAEEPPSDPATLDTLLGSEDVRLVAWGAHLAGREKVKAALPALLAFLPLGHDRSEDEWKIAYRHVLDALIRLDATVPAALLGDNLPPRLCRSAMALILLLREPETNQDVLLDQYDGHARDRRVLGIYALATGNVLASSKAPGFAARLVPRIETKLVLAIYDTDDIGLGGGAGGTYSGRGDAIVRQPDGYPPYPFYRLVLDDEPSPFLVADGVRPVGYRRTEREGTRFGWGGRVHRFEGADLAREWVASMVSIDVADLDLPERTSGYHRWTSPKDYLAWALAKRDAILARHDEVLGLLRKAGALTKVEIKDLHPALTIEIHDQRKHDTTPLPPLPKRAPRVRRQG